MAAEKKRREMAVFVTTTVLEIFEESRSKDNKKTSLHLIIWFFMKISMTVKKSLRKEICQLTFDFFSVLAHP